MEIFQKSVIKKYLQTLDQHQVKIAYQTFLNFYGNKARIQNITLLKEESYQEGFLRELFVQVLCYTINPDENYNLTTEFKNLTDAKKADAAILKDGKAIAVIELKSTQTKNLEAIKQQAFNYKNNQPDCNYVITSNFQLLRFYVDNATEFEEFDLFHLTELEFQKLYLILSKDNIYADLPAKLKQETQFHEQQISDQFYQDYSSFKRNIFNNLVANNPQYNKLLLFKKSQKLLDRLLFVFFAEDRGLVPPNSIAQRINDWQQLKQLEAYQPLYQRFKILFNHLDKGDQYNTHGLPGYDGGLFEPDEILDNVAIDDAILAQDSLKLSAYDFDTEIDVNILGHIFEHSLNEIEEITAELQGTPVDKKQTKRKKEGIFYTPKYITQYIVENTIGVLCQEKKQELSIADIAIDATYRRTNGKLFKTGKELLSKLNQYKDWLLSLKILDPACGSGAFLNQALDFLINEHQANDVLINDLYNQPLAPVDTDKTILENNLYGVDINEESVEIARLSLWLRTAKKGRKLSMLNNNIKCGNSLIDDPAVARDKAFYWPKEFPEIMANGGFHVIIGNPPYVATKQIPKDIRKYFWNRFKELLLNEMDLYELFLYVSSRFLLNINGYLGFITPNTYFTISSFINLRKYFFDYLNIIEIVDFPYRFFPFEDVNTETAIIILRNNFNLANLVELKTINKKSLLLNKEINKLTTKNSFSLKQNELKDIFKYKIITNPSTVIVKLLSLKNVFGNYLNLHKGWMSIPKSTVINGKLINKAVFLPEELHNYPSLNQICKKYLEGKDIHRYYFDNVEKYVNIDNIDSKTKLWHFSPKIILQRIVGQNVNKIFATLDIENFIIFPNANLVNLKDQSLSIYFFLGILNSKLISYFYNIFYGETNTNFTKEAFEQIPIPNLLGLKFDVLTNYVKFMLKINNEFQSFIIKFINRLQSNFKIPRISGKILHFYQHPYQDLIIELKKQKAILSLKHQDEWEDYFNDYKQKIIDLKRQIDQTDREIDQMVYQLYGLTPEEIEIVEQAVK